MGPGVDRPATAAFGCDVEKVHFADALVEDASWITDPHVGEVSVNVGNERIVFGCARN
jgi:hypothetical protein